MHIIILSLASPSTYSLFSLHALKIYLFSFSFSCPHNLIASINITGPSLSICTQHIPLLFFFRCPPTQLYHVNHTLLSIFDFRLPPLSFITGISEHTFPGQKRSPTLTFSRNASYIHFYHLIVGTTLHIVPFSFCFFYICG